MPKTSYTATKGLITEQGTGFEIDGLVEFKTGGGKIEPSRILTTPEMPTGTPLQLTASDSGKVFFTNTVAAGARMALPAAATITAGWHIKIISTVQDHTLSISGFDGDADASDENVLYGLPVQFQNGVGMNVATLKGASAAVDYLEIKAGTTAGSMFSDIVFDGTKFNVVAFGYVTFASKFRLLDNT